MTEPLTDLLQDAIEIGVRRERVRLPWWKAILKRRRYDIVIHSPLSDLLAAYPVGEGVVWKQIEILPMQSVDDD